MVETTRHYTATTYVVHEGATLLHEHQRLQRWLPPGGHVDRGELPHEAALREVREETGLDVELVAEREDIESETVRQLPKPRHFQLADVNVYDGEVGHQHVDMIYYARAPHPRLDPADGELGADRWEWFDPNDLESERVDPDVTDVGRRAIATLDSD